MAILIHVSKFIRNKKNIEPIKIPIIIDRTIKRIFIFRVKILNINKDKKLIVPVIAPDVIRILILFGCSNCPGSKNQKQHALNIKNKIVKIKYEKTFINNCNNNILIY